MKLVNPRSWTRTLASAVPDASPGKGTSTVADEVMPLALSTGCQYHGSAYGQAAAERGYQRAPGTWNIQEVTVVGSRITVELNGTRILDADLAAIQEFMYDAERFAGRLRTRGHFGFAGHNDPVRYRNVRIRRLD